MTLPVVDSWNLRGVTGKPYRVGPQCSNPDCTRFADHAHHIVRRSAIGGDYAWVEIEGKVYPNLCGLCFECHEKITGRISGHKAAIRLEPDGLFYWTDIVEHPDGKVTYLPFKPLDPHPLAPDSTAQRASNEEEPGACPVCGQTTKRRRAEKSTPGPARRRKTWPVTVPDDSEDGAAVLDTLYEDLAPMMHIDPTASGRYFVVVASLYYVHQNIATFLDSLRGVGA